MEFLSWIENLGPVTWIRESSSLLGYTLYLAGHTIGLVFLLGPNLLIASRVLGLVPDLSLRAMAKFKPVMTAGLWLTVITGTVLFATAPVSYVRNVVFITKIAAIVVALLCLRGVIRGLFADGRDPDEQPISARIKLLTAATLVLWTIAVVAGRLTAYSGVVVVASLGAFLVVVALAAVVSGVTWLMRRRRPSVPQEPPFVLDRFPTTANGGK